MGAPGFRGYYSEKRMNYEALYAKMVEAAEQAIEAIEAADYGRARQLLIAAEQGCEEAYLQKAE